MRRTSKTSGILSHEVEKLIDVTEKQIGFAYFTTLLVSWILYSYFRDINRCVGYFSPWFLCKAKVTIKLKIVKVIASHNITLRIHDTFVVCLFCASTPSQRERDFHAFSVMRFNSINFAQISRGIEIFIYWGKSTAWLIRYSVRLSK